MLRLEADITLPYVTSLSGSIAVYGGELGFVEWPLDVRECPVLNKYLWWRTGFC
jgi:hypothetical protein